MKKFFILLVLVFSAVGCNSKNSEPKTQDDKVTTKSNIATGKIVNGLRVYTEAELATGKISAYRGDYVIIEKTTGSETMKIDSLKVSHTYPVDESGKKYFKLKQVGTFVYNYGKTTGSITVKEYEQANYKSVMSKEAVEIIKNVDPLILDVRTEGEYKNGHLENSKLIPLQVIQSEYTQILDYKDKPVLVYCASGNRSVVASRVLIEQGFTKVYNLKRGIGEWYREGNKIVK